MPAHPTSSREQPVGVHPSPPVAADQSDRHSLLWMVICCAPMVLFVVALAIVLAVR